MLPNLRPSILHRHRKSGGICNRENSELEYQTDQVLPNLILLWLERSEGHRFVDLPQQTRQWHCLSPLHLPEDGVHEQAYWSQKRASKAQTEERMRKSFYGQPEEYRCVRWTVPCLKRKFAYLQTMSSSWALKQLCDIIRWIGLFCTQAGGPRGGAAEGAGETGPQAERGGGRDALAPETTTRS
jgi:hypothetical protein